MKPKPCLCLSHRAPLMPETRIKNVHMQWIVVVMPVSQAHSQTSGPLMIQNLFHSYQHMWRASLPLSTAPSSSSSQMKVNTISAGLHGPPYGSWRSWQEVAMTSHNPHIHSNHEIFDMLAVKFDDDGWCHTSGRSGALTLQPSVYN